MTDTQQVGVLLHRARDVTIPDAQRRRAGSDAAFESALSQVQGEIAEIYRHATQDNDGVLDDDTARHARIDLCLELASLLFAAGAAHGLWRWWAAQAANALLDWAQPAAAATWGVLADDAELVRRLPNAPPPGAQPESVVWWLATASRRPPTDDEVPGPGDDESVRAAWQTLAASIETSDQVRTARALRTITDFWIQEDDDWAQFHPGSYPDFEPELNAAAALASRSGWVPTDWPPDALRFLEAGLAPETDR